MSSDQTTQPEPPDGELVGAHLHGRADAFTILYRTYQPRLVAWLVRRTTDRAAAEDLAHDTLTRALSGLDSFDRDKPLWPWLRAIATNLATDQHRAAATQLPTVSHDDAIRDAQLATTDDSADLLAERDLLIQALHTLPDRQRVAMTLRYLHDWAPADIGRLLDLTRVSTEQLLLRARRRLCREYQKLARDEHYGWAWPLLLPYHALRDRLARLRDAITNTAPGPATATAEALASTAAVGVLTAAIAVSSLINPTPSLAEASSLSPDRVTPVSEQSPAVDTQPLALAVTSPSSIAASATTDVPSSGDAAGRVTPDVGSAEEGRSYIFVEVADETPVSGGQGHGGLEFDCVGPVTQALCDTADGFR